MKDLKNDFASFSESQHPAGSSFVLNKIHSEIVLPNPWMAGSKLGVAHALSSVATLSACAQFGVRLFFPGHGLMHYFMQISPTFCMAFCGALYLACTFLIARLLMTRDEFSLVLRSKIVSILSVTLITLSAFAFVSPEVTFETGILWLFGAVVGAELVSLRKSTVRRFFEAV